MTLSYNHEIKRQKYLYLWNIKLWHTRPQLWQSQNFEKKGQNYDKLKLWH